MSSLEDTEVVFPEPDVEYALGVRILRDGDKLCCPHGEAFIGVSPRDVALLCLNTHEGDLP